MLLSGIIGPEAIDQARASGLMQQSVRSGSMKKEVASTAGN